MEPIIKEDQRTLITHQFANQVAAYNHHHSILAWSFGNEMNGPWNGFVGSFNNAFKCGWNPADASSGGCFNFAGSQGECVESMKCVYKGLFEWLNEGARMAKQAMDVSKGQQLIISTLADVDHVVTRIEEMVDVTTDIDAWGLQVYRGPDFGWAANNLFDQYGRISSKPLLITEYGVDSYRDACGSSFETPCYNTAKNQAGGSYEDEETHAQWNQRLTKILLEFSSAENKGPVAGGCIMAWIDEWWKTTWHVQGCTSPNPYPSPEFDPSTCEYKAHVDCPNRDIRRQSLCGYPLASAFDGYVNEGYFGIMGVFPRREGQMDGLRQKLLYFYLRDVWVPQTSNTWLWMIFCVMLLSISTLVVLVSVQVSGMVRGKLSERVQQSTKQKHRTASDALGLAKGNISELKSEQTSPATPTANQRKGQLSPRRSVGPGPPTPTKLPSGSVGPPTLTTAAWGSGVPQTPSTASSRKS